MVWKTHKQGAVTVSLLIYPYFITQSYRFTKDKLQYLLLLLVLSVIIYNGAYYGTIFPDLDQNKHALPCKNWLTYTLSGIIHIMPINHRSWQTHSLDIYILLLGYPCVQLIKFYHMTYDALYLVSATLIISFFAGITTHIFMDMWSKQGAWLSVILSFIVLKLTKSNRSIEETRFSFVAWCNSAKTDSHYEEIFRKIVIILNRLLAIVIIILLVAPIVTPKVDIILGTNLSSYFTHMQKISKVNTTIDNLINFIN